jgi:hypothetical protein
MFEFEIERFDEVIIKIKKYNNEEYLNHLALGGSRILFDLEFIRFMDTIDENDNERYLILHFLNEEENNNVFYELELKPYYDLITLYLNDNNIELLYKEVDNIIEKGESN